MCKPGQDTTKFSKGVVDAYSVFASFNSTSTAGNSSNKGNTDSSTTGSTGAATDANGTATGKTTGTTNGASGGGVSLGVDLGELFATGDAAVQLAEGVNYYMARAGNAEIAKAMPAQSCVQQPTSAKNAGGDMNKVPGRPSAASPAGATPKPAPTLASVTPDTGSGPAVGVTAGTKVVVTLAGTGFDSASALAITGNAGVTYDQLMASSDGKDDCGDSDDRIGSAENCMHNRCYESTGRRNLICRDFYRRLTMNN